MKQTIKFQRVSTFRRLCSMILDFIIMLSLFVVVLSLIVNPIIVNTTKYNQKYQEYLELCNATHLYEDVPNTQNSIQIISKDYDEHLTEFYNDNDLNYTIADYNALKDEKTVAYDAPEEDKLTAYFIKDAEGNYVENTLEDKTANTKLQKDRDDWYYQIARKLVDEEIAKEPLEPLVNYIGSLTLLSYIISLVVAVLVTYLMFPMIFKDRTTIGKKMFQMEVIDGKTGRIASRFQVFIRFVFFALLNVALGIFTFGLSILFSLVGVIFTKKKQTMHDYIAGTLVVNASIKDNVSDAEIIEISYDDGTPEVDLGDVTPTYSEDVIDVTPEEDK